MDLFACVDSGMINTAIERERYPMNTIEELIVELNGAKFFSKIELNKEYHQLELSEESRYITKDGTFLHYLHIDPQERREDLKYSGAIRISHNQDLIALKKCRQVSRPAVHV